MYGLLTMTFLMVVIQSFMSSGDVATNSYRRFLQLMVNSAPVVFALVHCMQGVCGLPLAVSVSRCNKECVQGTQWGA